jgi:pyruvate dehydrogenase E1 component alpha subunit
LAVHAAVSAAVDRARAGDGPTLIEAVTYRLYGHVFGDRMTYVPAGELDAAWSAEPVGRFRLHLIDTSVLTEETARQIEADCDRLVAETLDEALTLVEPGAEELLTDVVAGSTGG